MHCVPEPRDLSHFITIEPGEQWLPFPFNRERYSISSYGRIFSWVSRYKYNDHTPRGLIKSTPNNLGYHMVALCFDGFYFKPIKRHQVIALTFHKKPDFKCEVHHIDHNPSNNRADNLAWVTHQENITLSVKAGRRKTPEGIGHWNFGKTFSERSKKKMSLAKQGTKHPKYKGYYMIYGQRYDSANDAAKNLNIHATQVIRNAKNPNKPEWEFFPQN